MNLKTMALHSHTSHIQTHKRFSPPSVLYNPFHNSRAFRTSVRYHIRPPSFDVLVAKNDSRNSIITACIGIGASKTESNVESFEEEEVVVEVVDSKREELVEQSIWKQMKDIVMFSGPATGLWICGPLMSLISTAVIGQGSSTELAALGKY